MVGDVRRTGTGARRGTETRGRVRRRSAETWTGAKASDRATSAPRLLPVSAVRTPPPHSFRFSALRLRTVPPGPWHYGGSRGILKYAVPYLHQVQPRARRRDRPCSRCSTSSPTSCCNRASPAATTSRTTAGTPATSRIARSTRSSRRSSTRSWRAGSSRPRCSRRSAAATTKRARPSSPSSSTSSSSA